ncbi:YihY/virulence factor BrkB family protein [Ferruginibacter sp. HRS2-29]|uniref:YihY/virulence factor BrkB family protein n=1 Tax=Ferruginibacter sp. HRS2-29 TaxID=2487334 RepID=UPI0020CDF8B1|nr:YihY/virulence factor BrkB family protein [Ferruginibacter sp. HRS2-29]MCP9749538.1 YihY/virulence factor BrkB family protein [Ferruginibacter sp. HRS2-29]
MKRKLLFFFRFNKQVITEFIGDNVLKYSASLAYYTILSLAPLLVIVLFIAGSLFGREAISGQLYSEINDMVGSAAALEIQNAIAKIHLSSDNVFATTIGVIILVIGATGIFGEMQDSLNKIWGLRTKTRKVWWKLLVDRMISFSLILSLGFVLIVSLALNAVVAALSARIGNIFAGMGETVLIVIDNLISLFVTTILFGTIFKVLPDAKIKWKDVMIGAFITSLLFMLGKYGIGLYLGKSKLSSIYGAAGSVMIIMIWVYYSSAILYLGAVFTKVYATNFGGKIFPNDYSVWIKMEEIPVPAVTLKE